MILTDDNLNYDLVNEGRLIRVNTSGRNATYRIVIGADDEPALYFVSVRFPLMITESRRAAVAEAIVRINHGLMFGRFDLDMSDGELDFYVAVPICSAPLSTEQFWATLTTAIHTIEDYHRAFGRLLYADDLSPAEAVAEITMGASD